MRGGAGGATAFGGAIGLWPPIILYIIPFGLIAFFIIGYASVTTISVAVIVTLVFFVRALMGLSPWAYVFYGILSIFIVLYALRPNLKRLREGTERPVGLRAYLRKKAAQKQAADHSTQSS
jgi:acyl phosphate:glycerol-3-phosphate acyltransferase